MLGKCADDIIGPALLLEPGVGAQVSPGIYVVRVYRRSPGRQLQIIYDGGTTAAWMDQDPSIASSSRTAVEALLDAAL